MSLIIANRTAFPLNVAFLQRKSYLRHINSLQPGSQWSTDVPRSVAPFPASLIPFRHAPTTTICVLFDKEHNRFAPTPSSSAPKNRQSLALRWNAVLLSSLGCALLAASACGSSAFGRTDLLLPQPAILVYLMFIVFIAIVTLGFYSHLGFRRSCRKAQGHGSTILSIPVPNRTLRPSPPSAPAAGVTVQSSPSASLDRHFELVWSRSRVILWDADRNQELVASDS